MITNFLAFPTSNEGELKLTWTKGSGVIIQKILMSGSRYAMSDTDGTEIYSGTGEEITVSDLVPERFYYFTLFYKISTEWLTGTKCRTTGLTIKIKKFKYYDGFDNFLYKKLPEIYRHMDKFQNTPDTLPLKRFLSLFGNELNLLYSRINAYKEVVTDIDRTSDTYLDRMCKFLGWTPNKEIPIDRQRMELKGVYEFYKNKGTLLGVKNFIVAISGFYIKVKEFRNLCFKTNTSMHRTMDTSFTAVEAYGSIKATYEDTYPVICNASRGNTWDKYRLNSIGVFIYGDISNLSPSGLTREQIENKINRMWKVILPSGIDGYIIWSELKDQDGIEVKDYYRTIITDYTQWIKSNTLNRTTNTLGVWTPGTNNTDDNWE